MSDPLAARLTLKQLRLVAAVAEHRQLSLAAQALSLTQPAASRSLGEIEQLCGDVLFERHPRGMTLTPLGELLARRARNVLEEVEEAADEVARFRAGRGGTVRIGAVTGGAIGLIVPAIGRLKQAAPDAEVHVEVAMSRELIRGVRAMRLDFVLARVPPDVDPSEFDVLRAGVEHVDVIARRGHPLADRGPVTLTDLLSHDWVMQASGAPIRVAIEEALLGQGARPPMRVTNTSSLLVTIAMLEATDALAPVSREVARLLTGGGAAPGLAILPVVERVVVAPYSLLSIRGRRLAPVAQRCRDLVAGMLDLRQDGDAEPVGVP